MTINAAYLIAKVEENIENKIVIKTEFRRLAGNGLELEGERMLEDYNIRPGQTLWIVYPRGETPLDMEFLAIHGHGMDLDGLAY